MASADSFAGTNSARVSSRGLIRRRETNYGIADNFARAIRQSGGAHRCAGCTWALNRIWQNRPDLQSDVFTDLLAGLSKDMSSKVRLAADTSATWLKVERPDNSEEIDGPVDDPATVPEE